MSSTTIKCNPARFNKASESFCSSCGDEGVVDVSLVPSASGSLDESIGLGARFLNCLGALEHGRQLRLVLFSLGARKSSATSRMAVYASSFSDNVSAAESPLVWCTLTLVASAVMFPSASPMAAYWPICMLTRPTPTFFSQRWSIFFAAASASAGTSFRSPPRLSGGLAGELAAPRRVVLLAHHGGAEAGPGEVGKRKKPVEVCSGNTSKPEQLCHSGVLLEMHFELFLLAATALASPAFFVDLSQVRGRTR